MIENALMVAGGDGRVKRKVCSFLLNGGGWGL